MLAVDLVAALGALREVTRTATADAGTYRYKYAELGDVLAIARPVLACHGLALLTVLEDGTERTITVRARFLHRSGDTLEAGELTMPRGGTAQATGSAITYARRYLVMAALALGTDDDDGQEHTATPAVEPVPLHNPDRLFAIEVFERIKGLDPADREAFNLWRGQHHPEKAITVPAMTRDPEWARDVSAAVYALELGAGDPTERGTDE